MKASWKAIRDRLGPVGLSLAAAAVTAAGFAALSIADDGESGDGDEQRGDRMVMPAPPPGVHMFRERLSDEDRKKLEEFRQCMEDNGAPPPPRLDREDGPPEPPSEEERGQIEDAFEACRENLPEDVPRAGPPPFGCPPPALRDDEDGERGEDDSTENEQQGYVIPAPSPGASS